MKSASNSRWLVLTMLLIPALSYTQPSHNSHTHTKHKENNMVTTAKNKEVVRNLYEQSLNKGNMALLKEYVSDDYTGQQGKKGVAAFEEPVLALIRAFPGMQWKIEELIGEGNKVMVKWKWQGTHTGQFTNFAATGKTMSNEGMGIYEFRNGKIISTQVHTDRLGFLQEMEVIPTDITALTNRKDQVHFIDRFFVPAAARNEFYERMRINRSFIKTLPGFIEDAAYGYTDNDGNLVCVTVARWQNQEALDKAKEAVQAEYKKQGFDAAAMFNRLHITADRGIYTAIKGQ
jgi:steroid delta-isomerase-like uncharacterized protein